MDTEQHLAVFTREAFQAPLLHAMPEWLAIQIILEVTAYPRFTAENTSRHPTCGASTELG